MPDAPKEDFGFTFSAKKTSGDHWLTSAGRWETAAFAAMAASQFMIRRALLGEQWQISIDTVYELSVDESEPLTQAEKEAYSSLVTEEE